MEELADAWVPGRAGLPAAREPDAGAALRRLADAMTAAEAGDQSASDLLLADARWLLGDSAAKTIFAMQVRGELPLPGAPGWDRLLARAAAGDVEIVTLVVVRESVPPVPPVPPEPAKVPAAPSLADEMRAMGLM